MSESPTSGTRPVSFTSVKSRVTPDSPTVSSLTGTIVELSTKSAILRRSSSNTTSAVSSSDTQETNSPTERAVVRTKILFFILILNIGNLNIEYQNRVGRNDLSGLPVSISQG